MDPEIFFFNVLFVVQLLEEYLEQGQAFTKEDAWMNI